jgi:F-type H+-transporting ATPase subunit delta
MACAVRPRRRRSGKPPRRVGATVAGEDPLISGMAGRYATALFELVLAADQLEPIGAELDRFEGLLAESPELVRLVRSPVFSSEEQLRALTPVLDRAGIGGLTARFLKVVTANRRLFAIRDIMRAYRLLVARHKGELTARLTVAERPSETRLAEVKDALHAVTGKHVGLEVEIDPAIIGGLIVKVGSRMIDSSLRTKLNAIKHAMKEVG